MMIPSGPSLLMLDPYGDFLHHLRMEPFQVFCHEKRPEVCRSNPYLSSSRITSLLGSMWRSLKPYEKQAYIDIAVSMKPRESPEVSSPINPPTPVISQPKPEPVKKPQEHVQPGPVQLIIPHLDIIPRGTKWKEISQISQACKL